MMLTWAEFGAWMKREEAPGGHDDRDESPADAVIEHASGAGVLDHAASEGAPRRIRTLHDGTIVKVFRPSRRSRYGGRFYRSARGLRARGISTIRIVERYRLTGAPGGDRDAVRYEAITGRSIESILHANDVDAERAAFDGLSGFMVHLHASGVYFRGLHLGNVIVGPDGTYGLVDVTDTRFRPWSLTVGERARNFRPMLRYEDQRAGLARYGPGRLAADYLRAAALPAFATQRLTERLSRLDPLVDPSGEP